MTKFLQKIKHMFYTSYSRYSLSLIDLETVNNRVICVFKVSGDLIPIKILLDEVFITKNILHNLEPSTILLLKEFQIKNNKSTARIKAINRNNHYVILAEDKELTLSGDQICRDKYMLSVLSIDDAFKIIYNTAYKNGSNDHKIHSISIKTSISKSTLLRLVQ